VAVLVAQAAQQQAAQETPPQLLHHKATLVVTRQALGADMAQVAAVVLVA
jgi:hypothetical protein